MNLMKNNKIKYSIVVVVLVVVIIFGNNLISSADRQVKEVEETTGYITVEVQKIETTSKRATLSGSATLEPGYSALVSARVGGRVIEVLFENGQEVKAGDPLVILDSQNLSQQMKALELTVRKLEANMISSRQTYERMKELYETGAISAIDMDNTELALQLAEADLETGKINLDMLRDNIENTIIRAPLNGIVDEKSVVVGQYISTGGALASVKDISTLKAVMQVKQEEYMRLREGMAAKINVRGAASEVYPGKVKRIGLSASTLARTFSCEVEMDNTENELRPGVYASILLQDEQQVEVIEIPLSALSGSEDNYEVFVYEDGIARKKSVDVSEITGNCAEIISGLQIGEEIILTNLSVLNDGEFVQRAEQEA